jgi:hypothetical protein
MDPQAIFDEVQVAGMRLFEDLKYPMNRENQTVFLNYMHPDILPVIVHHLISCGYRIDPTKQVVKPRKVVGPGIPEDFHTYVPVDGPDEPLTVQRPTPPKREGWSVRPQLNVIEEKRAE